MKLFSENIEDLRTLYVTGLKKALDMEQKITKALPTMIEKSTDTQLASAFRNHLTQTEGHVAKVQNLLRNATGDDSTSTCKAISALITEAEDNIKDAAEPSIRDITLIASAQQVEHHEIAVYGTLRSWAELLGQDGAANTLESSSETLMDALAHYTWMHWDVALNQGRYVGRSWAGAESGPYNVVPYFFSDLADWTWFEYVGPAGRDDAVEVRGSMDDDDFVAYYSDPEGKLTGCLGVNRSDEVNEAKELIAAGGTVPAAS